MNQSCCFVLQSMGITHADIKARVTKEIEIRRVSNNSLIAKHTRVTKLYRINNLPKFNNILHCI